MVLRLMSCSPRGPGSFAPVIRRLSPAPSAPASGRQDHTPSPSAPVSLVLRHCRVHRIPLPTSVTTAKRPSCRSGTARTVHNFYFSESEIFARDQLTTGISLNQLTKLDFVRTRFGAVCDRVRDVNAVELVKLICPTQCAELHSRLARR